MRTECYTKSAREYPQVTMTIEPPQLAAPSTGITLRPETLIETGSAWGSVIGSWEGGL
jgi:hypothetical protein